MKFALTKSLTTSFVLNPMGHFLDPNFASEKIHYLSLFLHKTVSYLGLSSTTFLTFILPLLPWPTLQSPLPFRFCTRPFSPPPHFPQVVSHPCNFQLHADSFQIFIPSPNLSADMYIFLPSTAFLLGHFKEMFSFIDKETEAQNSQVISWLYHRAGTRTWIWSQVDWFRSPHSKPQCWLTHTSALVITFY